MTLKLRFGYRSLQLPLDLEIFVLYNFLLCTVYLKYKLGTREHE